MNDVTRRPLRAPESSVAAAFRELSPSEARLLEASLLDAAHRNGSTGRDISSVDRSPLESTWYRTECVEVTLDSGERMKFFLKDFRSYERDKGRMPERRERERFFYKEVFPHGELGLPTFVADVWTDEKAWLIIEFVEAVPLGWREIETWYEAAGWLGAWQTKVVERLRPLRDSKHFLQRDPSYFQNIARNATAGAARFGDYVEQKVRTALPGYLRGTEELTRQPQTLVHGAFRPNQILVDPEETPVRICPTDWEIAAIGSCIYDLAALTDGFSGPMLETFLDRFLAEAKWLRNDPPDISDLELAIKTCSTHRTLKWIAQAEKRGFSPDKIRELATSLAGSQPGRTRSV